MGGGALRYFDNLDSEPWFVEHQAKHPLQARIVRAALIRADWMLENAGNLNVFRRLSAEFCELTSWLADQENHTTDAELIENLRANLAAGWPAALALQYRELQRRRPRGRPRSGRRRIMLALEYRQLHPKTSWMRLAMMFCACAAPHKESCKERLRQQVRTLSKTLADLGV